MTGEDLFLAMLLPCDECKCAMGFHLLACSRAIKPEDVLVVEVRNDTA